MINFKFPIKYKFLYVLVFISLSSVCSAQNHGKLGLGYNDGISLRYWLKPKTALEVRLKYSKSEERYNPPLDPNIGYQQTLWSSWSQSQILNVLQSIYHNEHINMNVGIGFSAAKWGYKSENRDSNGQTRGYSQLAKHNLGLSQILWEIEYFFKEIPQLGFGFEIGYDFEKSKIERKEWNDTATTIGTQKSRSVSYGRLGTHYYFP